MSGGHFNYAYCEVDVFLESLKKEIEEAKCAGSDFQYAKDSELKTPEVFRFTVETFFDVMFAKEKMKAIEWLFSGDSGIEYTQDYLNVKIPDSLLKEWEQLFGLLPEGKMLDIANEIKRKIQQMKGC